MKLCFSDGSEKSKDFTDMLTRHAWRSIQAKLRKQLYQRAEVTRKTGAHVTSSTGYDPNEGIGGRFKWLVRNEDVYHPAMQAVIEKHFHHRNAVCITPDSWLDKQLQETYYARRCKTKKENTDEQKNTTE
jgi:hypothetical protein